MSTPWWTYVAALIPFLGGALICYVIFKALLEGDRNERKARKQWEQERGVGQSGQSGQDGPED